MGFLKNLTFTQGNSELVDGEFFVPVPDGFHACLDQAVIGEARSIVIVPKDYSFYDDPMEAEFALSIQANPFSIPKPMSPENKDVYIQVLQQNSSLFDENPVLDIRIREGAGTLCQFAWGTDWLKIFGVFFAGTQGYIFHLMWNFQTLSGNAQEMVEAFYKQAKRWLERIHLPGEEESPRFRFATPDEGLYPHYEHIRSASRGLPGVVMVVNANGTEYEFIPLKNEDNDVSKKIAAVPLEPFSLSDTAWEMAGIFRVDKSVFDSKHDRECQLKNRYMHRAYMMSALRSFFWTVSTYCEDNAITPEQLTRDDVSGIVDHIAAQQWLNYCNDDHGSCICSIQDFHVYYVPKKTDMEDQRALMIAALAQNTGSFPSDLTYLDDLRDDLEYVYPAIHIIYDELAENRDPYQQLTGNKADVLYAWCALTIAAKEPFYAEDGPMSCWFEQCDDVITPPSTNTKIKGTVASKATSNPHHEVNGFEQLSKEDCEIDAIDTLEHYWGPHKRIILPNGITRIGENCFMSDIEGVVIPEGVTYLSKSAFFCTNVEFVYLPHSLETIWNGAFRSCGKLKEIIIPEGVDWIGDDAFTNCKSLTDIYVPSSVTYIGTNAFCTLTDNLVIHTPHGSEAHRYAEENGVAFDHRPTPHREIPKAKMKTPKAAAKPKKPKTPVEAVPANPEDFVIEDGVLKEYKGSANTLLIPEGIHTIAKEAFFMKSSLKSVTIPEGVKTIEPDAFHFCSCLEQVTLPSTLVTLSGFYSTYLKKITIPPKVKTIGRNAFRGCEELKRVILPSSVKRVEQGAFSWCNKKKDVYIPESVTKIDDHTFDHAPRTVLHIHPGSYAEEFALSHKVKFDYEVQDYIDELEKTKQSSANKKSTPKVAQKQLSATVAPMPAQPNGPFDLSSTGKTLNKYKGNDDLAVIPDGVATIDSHAFANANITAVTIPDSVTKIEHYAFSHCIKLKEIALPASVTTVGEFAFWGCTSLSRVTWPGTIKKVPPSAFDDCKELVEVVLEEGVTEIGQSAFYNCGKLKAAYLPTTLKNVGQFAFLLASNVKLYAYSGSYAEQYARENKLALEVLLTPEQKAQQEAEQKRRKEEAARRQQEEEKRRRLKAEAKARMEVEEAETQRRIQERMEQRRREELAEKRARYDHLKGLIAEQERIISENRGWFGAQAKTRKIAQGQLNALQEQLLHEFPKGKP